VQKKTCPAQPAGHSKYSIVQKSLLPVRASRPIYQLYSRKHVENERPKSSLLGAALLAVLYPMENPFYSAGIMLFEAGVLLRLPRRLDTPVVLSFDGPGKSHGQGKPHIQFPWLFRSLSAAPLARRQEAQTTPPRLVRNQRLRFAAGKEALT
jgi:hypothetical protein